MALRQVITYPLAGVGWFFPAWLQAVDNTTSTPELATGHLVRVTLGLLAVLISIVVVARLLRGFARFQTGSHRQFKILSAISIGPRERIVLLQIGETQLLVGVVPGRIQTLHVLERPIDVLSTPPSSSAAFPPILGAVLKRSKGV